MPIEVFGGVTPLRIVFATTVDTRPALEGLKSCVLFAANDEGNEMVFRTSVETAMQKNALR
jgi:hypothetical protein